MLEQKPVQGTVGAEVGRVSVHFHGNRILTGH
jgi:hypothetical protein